MTNLHRPAGGLLLGFVAACAFAVSAEAQYFPSQPFPFGPPTDHPVAISANAVKYTVPPWLLTSNPNVFGQIATSGSNTTSHNTSHSSSSSSFLEPFAYGPPRYGETFSGATLVLPGVTNNAATSTFTGTLRSGDTGTLTRSGGGTLVLTGTNTYTGGNTVTTGTLQSYGGGTLNLSGWDPYDFETGGTFVSTGTLQLTNNAALSLLGSNAYAVALAPSFTGSLGNGNLTLTNGGVWSTGSDLAIGNLTMFPSPVLSISGNNLTVGTSSSSFFNQPASIPPTVHVLAPVPEPGTMALLVLAGMFLLCPRPWRLFLRSPR